METENRFENEKTELRARLTAALEKAKDGCERLQDKTVAAARATDEAIREHPYQAVGVALGAGVLIGLLLARSRD